MTLFSALANAYERMAKNDDVVPFGYSEERISFLICLSPDGSLPCPPIDLREKDNKNKLTPRYIRVPLDITTNRTSGISPNFLWDKTSYTLGITGQNNKRLKEEHQAFVEEHKKLLSGTSDEGLKAFLAFLDKWNPQDFETVDWPEEIKTGILDQNIIFCLENDKRDNLFLHLRPEAQSLWAKINAEKEATESICLVTGKKERIARLHPSIKGIWGGQPAGCSIVSFNAPAFESYGHEQGMNAPFSEQAAFAYTMALNKFLQTGSLNRLQIGDASTVFWAEASQQEAIKKSECIFMSFFEEIDENAQATQKIKPFLEKIGIMDKIVWLGSGN